MDFGTLEEELDIAACSNCGILFFVPVDEEIVKCPSCKTTFATPWIDAREIIHRKETPANE